MKKNSINFHENILHSIGILADVSGKYLYVYQGK